MKNPWNTNPEFKLKGLRKMDEEEMHKRIDAFEAWFDLKYSDFINTSGKGPKRRWPKKNA